MVTFHILKTKLIFSYDYDDRSANIDWVRRELKNSGNVRFKKTFNL